MRLTDIATLVALAYHLSYVFAGRSGDPGYHILLALFFGGAYILTQQEGP